MKNKGFTIIELMIVLMIGVIGVMVLIGAVRGTGNNQTSYMNVHDCTLVSVQPTGRKVLRGKYASDEIEKTYRCDNGELVVKE